MQTLSGFQYIDSSGRYQGSNVRKKFQSLVALVNDKERIQEARQKALANMEKICSTNSLRGSYGDEDRYGIRDDDRNGYERESEYGYKDDDRNSRGGDSYNRDGDRYGRDSDGGYKDDDYNRGRSRSNEDFCMAREVGNLMDTGNVVVMTMVVIHQGIWAQVEKHLW
ncbi:clathrin interactor EPSIN 2-like [Papaver somniferum]|uniref:clathrin interactor EPSIN 2-like n=1 Tax=Papaver somniferum TaxID=3469 RepID=UPI000E704F78|nr:clathrin interactor EPSIN 2-like [Papaver somniferum]XP_026407981.1 clathrin interactor EPSIN 2-like [Papaver somniferum]XP_026407982.1 clathrin interactor EPSIN 2-like [Papaver somniferum]XP_026407983.1 clathrin interactor EPSIN 2-like [Papaver somniferum]XP_026407984.1 clathrin interactor EPSIN 2-like [Papaver somniferum]XP_026407985.1 clathrin interactor EPSIN 2-like [Papaver somniferum]